MTLLRTQLGNTLRGHRLSQRRTLRDVSGAARVSLGYLSEVERGQKEASSELLASICAAAGAPAPRRAVPTPLARAAGAVAETLLRRDPPMTRFLAEQLSTAHWFDQREARAALGWVPRVGLDEGFRRLHAAGMC